MFLFLKKNKKKKDAVRAGLEEYFAGEKNMQAMRQIACRLLTASF
jgi:hypothetical protein